MVGAVILAAGKGERMGGLDKAFAEVARLPLLAYSLLAFAACPDVGPIVVVARGHLLEKAREVAAAAGVHNLHAVVAGGATRQASSLVGVRALPPDAEFVAVHDAARPLVTPALVSDCIVSAREFGSGVAASRVVDTMREVVDSGQMQHPGTAPVAAATRTRDRARLWSVATPQVFRRADLLAALEAAEGAGESLTDDASAIERAGGHVHLVECREPNFKVTAREDLVLAEAMIKLKEERSRNG